MKFGYFNPRDYYVKYKYGVVESPEIFVRGTTQFHPKGLFSTEIFGTLEERQFKKGIILFPEGFKVLHPEFYDILIKRARNIYLALKGEIALEYNPKTGKLEKASDITESSLIGLSVIKFLEENIDKVDVSSAVKQLIELYGEHIWIDSIFVIPPADRDVLIEGGKILHIHPINNLYANLIKLVQTIDFDFQRILNARGNEAFSLMKYLFMWVSVQDLVHQIQQAVRTILAGKQGFIRSVVLGKRLDFTARSVITPNPNLRHDQIGVPYKILAKILEPFVIHVILHKKDPQTGKQFKEELETALKMSLVPATIRVLLTKFRDGRITKEVSDILKRAIEIASQNKVVLAKRDPALHRPSTQAFLIVPVEGSAIQIPPQITPPYNADFDGDSILGTVILETEDLNTGKRKLIELALK